MLYASQDDDDKLITVVCKLEKRDSKLEIREIKSR